MHATSTVSAFNLTSKRLQWLGWIQGAPLQVLQQSHQLHGTHQKHNLYKTSHQLHVGSLPGAWSTSLGLGPHPLCCNFAKGQYLQKQPGPFRGTSLPVDCPQDPPTSCEWQILCPFGGWTILGPLSARRLRSDNRPCEKQAEVASACWKARLAMTSRHKSNGWLLYIPYTYVSPRNCLYHWFSMFALHCAISYIIKSNANSGQLQTQPKPGGRGSHSPLKRGSHSPLNQKGSHSPLNNNNLNMLLNPLGFNLGTRGLLGDWGLGGDLGAYVDLSLYSGFNLGTRDI